MAFPFLINCKSIKKDSLEKKNNNNNNHVINYNK